MEKLTAADLQKIATLLKTDAGIEIKVMPSEFVKTGTAFLLMNAEDVAAMSEIFKAQELGVSPRTLIRKARQLGIQKEPDFLKKRKDIISKMAQERRPPNDQKTIDRITEAGKAHRFKKGHKPMVKDYSKIWETRRRNQMEVQHAMKNPYLNYGREKTRYDQENKKSI